MKMNFSELEIVSMIDFALKNQGAPAQIAGECEIQSFSKNGKGYQIDVLTGLESELLPTADQSPEDDGRTEGTIQICEFEGCENEYLWLDPRQKYCKDETCKKNRLRAANQRRKERGDADAGEG